VRPAEKAARTGALVLAALAATLFSLGADVAGWCALAAAAVTAGWCLREAFKRASAVLEDADREITEGRRARRARGGAGRRAA
jgi:hypothetical protein